MRCFLKIENPIDLRTSAGLIAFNKLFNTFARHPKVQAIRDKIADLRREIDDERRRVPRASVVYNIYDKAGKLVGASTRARDDTPYTYKERAITQQQAAAEQARRIKEIEGKSARLERSVDTAVGKLKQPKSAWDPLDAPDAAERIQAAGYDGIILKENTGEVSYAVIEPTQVKAVRNRGAFDPNSPNIYEALIAETVQTK